MQQKMILNRRFIAIGLSAVLAFGTAGALVACSVPSNTDKGSAVQSGDQSATRTVTLEGMDYQVPAQVDKVAPTIGALAQVTEIVSVDGDNIAATTTRAISDQFKTVFNKYSQGNPTNADTSDIESVIAAGVQVTYGPSSVYSDEQRQQLADAGIVFIPMDNIATIDGICNITEAIGQILGDEEYARAKQFTAYWKDNIFDARSRTAGLTDDQKPTVLNLSYNNGAFTTESGAALISEYIKAAGGKSLSEDYSAATSGNGGGKGGATVSEEQIVAWNPDYIITFSPESTEQVLNNPALAEVPAIKDGHVYTSPKGLYLWSVRSGEGALMAPWVGTKINADRFADIDMVKMVQDFFSTYYNYSLTEDQANAVLAGTSF